MSVRVERVESRRRGRSLVATLDAAPSQLLLCEAPIAHVPLPATADDAHPWATAAALVAAVLDADAEPRTHHLEPRLGLDELPALGEPASAAAFDAAALDVHERYSARASAASVRRLLHVVSRNALETSGCQALFQLASMANHSCRPNATHQGFRSSSGLPCVCIRAVSPIAEGDEVCISYIGDLAVPRAERAAALAHYGVEPDPLPSDAALGELLVSLESAESALGTCNRDADAAWEAWRASGDRALLLESATHYAKLVGAAKGVLGEGHALLIQARERLAHAMTATDAARSCRNAIPLLRLALRAMRPALPAAWPQLLVPLRALVDAARTAGDDEAEAIAQEEVERLVGVLQLGCEDARNLLDLVQPSTSTADLLAI